MYIQLTYTHKTAIKQGDKTVQKNEIIYRFMIMLERIAYISSNPTLLGRTKICFSAREDDYLIADQSYDEVLRLIDEARRAERAVAVPTTVWRYPATPSDIPVYTIGDPIPRNYENKGDPK